MQASMSLYGVVALNAAGMPVIANGRAYDERGRPRAAGWQYAPREYKYTRNGRSAFGHYRRKPRPDPEITYGDGIACVLPNYRDMAKAYRERPKPRKVKADLRPQHAKGLPCVCRDCKTTVRLLGQVEHAVKDHL